MPDPKADPTPAVPPPSEARASKEEAGKKCEACGSHGGNGERVRVRTTNGGLLLCRQCLNDINRKNPRLIAAEAELARLRAPVAPAEQPKSIARSLNPDQLTDAESAELYRHLAGGTAKPSVKPMRWEESAEALSEERLAEIAAREQKARDMVVALCQLRGSAGAREWTMSIPARLEHDSDLVIAASLDDIPDLLREVARLKEELAGAKRQAEYIAKAMSDAQPALADAWQAIRGNSAECAELRASLAAKDAELAGLKQRLDDAAKREDQWIRDHDGWMDRSEKAEEERDAALAARDAKDAQLATAKALYRLMDKAASESLALLDAAGMGRGEKPNSLSDCVAEALTSLAAAQQREQALRAVLKRCSEALDSQPIPHACERARLNQALRHEVAIVLALAGPAAGE